jgi:hypothetical protein
VIGAGLPSMITSISSRTTGIELLVNVNECKEDAPRFAPIDGYGDSEQAGSFYTMMENDLRLPFETEILGVAATVESIDITNDDQLVAIYRKGKTRQRISLMDLPLPSPLPEGAEWIVAYRYWRARAA